MDKLYGFMYMWGGVRVEVGPRPTSVGDPSGMGVTA